MCFTSCVPPQLAGQVYGLAQSSARFAFCPLSCFPLANELKLGTLTQMLV